MISEDMLDHPFQMTKENIKKVPNYAGVYRIRNLINNKSYVGCSYNLRERLLQHYNGDDMKAEVKKRKKTGLPVKYVHQVGHNLLYDDIADFGYAVFEVSILFWTLTPIKYKDLLRYESYYITQYKCNEEGYNKYNEEDEDEFIGTD